MASIGIEWVRQYHGRAKDLDRYDHTRYVVAVDIPPTEVKRLRAAHHAARPVL
jgi:hypothetical protein